MGDSQTKNNKQGTGIDPYPDRRERLRELLLGKGVDAVSLQSFLDVTEISPGLRGLLGLVVNLPYILPIIANDPKNHLPVDRVLSVCEAIRKSTREELACIDESLLETPGSNQRQLANLYNSRALYCFLWHRCRWKQDRGEYTRFKANFLLAYRRLADDIIPPPIDPDYEPAVTFLQRCCLAGRKIGYIGSHSFEARAIENLRKRLSDESGFDAYCAAMLLTIGELKNTEPGYHAKNTLRELENLFSGRYPGTRDYTQDGVDLPPPPKPVAPAKPPVKLPVAVVDKLDIPYEPIVVTVTPEPGKGPSGQLLKIRPKTPKYTTEDDKFLYMAHRGRVNMIAMTNQNLPWSWDRLSEYEVGVLQSHLADHLKFLGLISQKRHISPYLLRAFICFAFYAGRSGADFCAIRIGKPAGKADDETYYNDDNGELNFPTYEPQAGIRSGSLGARPHTRRLKLKLVQDLRNAVTDWAMQYDMANGMTWCDESTAGEIESAASHWLKRLNQEADTRLSLPKVKAHLYRTLTCRLDSDEAMAIAITGSRCANGFSPASYQALHPTVLQRHYDLAFSDGQVSREINIPMAESDLHVGSAKVPRALSTKRLAFDLQHEIALKGMYEYHQSFVRLHNLFAIYTYLVIGFCTGFRQAANPFSHPAYFDASTSELVLSEKDRNNYAHARPVWVPRVAAEQIGHYLDHLKVVEDRLVLLDPGLAGGRLAHRQQHPRLAGERKSIIDTLASEAAFIFVVDEKNGERTPMSPVVANAWLEDNGFGQLHDNAWRQSYRTLLRDSNCPDRVVRAAMGHWRTGEEGFYRYSSLLPEVYRSTLDKHITPIVEALGWIAIPSPLRNRL